MKFAGPVAKGFGLSLQETVGILGQMGNAGIQASLAGTSLRGALTRLASPSKEANDILSRLGVSTRKSNGDVRNLVEILVDLEKAGINTTQTMEVFGLRAGPGISTLLQGGIDKLQKYIKSLSNLGDISGKIQKQQLKGFNGQLLLLKSAFEALQIAVAESGMLAFFTSMLKSLTSLLSTLSRTNPAFLRFATVVLGLVATIGPLVIILAVATLAFRALAIAIAVTNGRILLIPAIIIGLIILIGLLVDELVNFAKGNKTVLGAVLKEWVKFAESVDQILHPVFESIEQAIRDIFSGISGLAGDLVSLVGGIFFTLGELVDEALEGINNAIDSVVSKLKSVSTFFSRVGSSIGQTFGDAFSFGGGTLPAPTPRASDFVSQGSRGASGSFSVSAPVSIIIPESQLQGNNVDEIAGRVSRSVDDAWTNILRQARDQQIILE
jgi:hypothetical protein